MAGCYKWGFEPKCVEDCPLIGGGECPCTCGLFDEEEEKDEEAKDEELPV
jgi:hypothetical protein